MEIKSLHTHVDIVARSKGHSVIAKAAYNARDKLQDEYYGKTHDYSKKEDLVFSKLFLPEHIPKEFSNREYLWNEVEKIEKSKVLKCFSLCSILVSNTFSVFLALPLSVLQNHHLHFPL